MSYPDRIDFQVLADRRVVVVKMRRADGYRDIPTRHEIKTTDFDLDAALAWCKENGYTVRRWPSGARAWRGKPWPVRTAHQIVKLRRKLEADWLTEFRRNPGKWSTFDTLLSLDLAYDG
jgi:hypothetical protein